MGLSGGSDVLQDRYGEDGLAQAKALLGPRRVWGAPRLFRGYIHDNDDIGTDLYIAEWGGVGPALLKVTGESRRYLTSTFVHTSFAHFVTLGVVTIIAATLVERRCVSSHHSTSSVRQPVSHCGRGATRSWTSLTSGMNTWNDLETVFRGTLLTTVIVTAPFQAVPTNML
jgi:hypothetical protein